MDERTFGGLTLREYASVYAATSEGFPLDLVLEGGGLTPGQWAAIDEAWGDAFSSDLQADGTLSDEFDVAMFEAQEMYSRPIPPLDDDLHKWLLFVRAWSGAADPVEFLRERGLGANDLARLHRAWSGRLAENPDLQKQALAAIEGEGEAPMPQPAPLELRSAIMREPPDVVTVSEVEPPRSPSLRAPLPAAKGAEALPPRQAPPTAADDDGKTWVEGPLPLADTGEERTQVPTVLVDPFAAIPLPGAFVPPPVDTVIPNDPSLADELTLAHHAALCAELDVAPEDAVAIFIKYGLANDERRARIDALWRERLETRTTTYAEWRQLYRHFREHFVQMRRR
jgi:hypothetical protein